MNNSGDDASSMSNARIEHLNGVKTATCWDSTGQLTTCGLLGGMYDLESPRPYLLSPSSDTPDGGAYLYGVCPSFLVVSPMFSTWGLALPLSSGAYDMLSVRMRYRTMSTQTDVEP